MSSNRCGLLRWSTSLAIVLGVHAAGIALALWWNAHAPDVPTELPPEALMVELAARPEAPPAPPRELPPGPLQREQHRPQPRPVAKIDLPPDDAEEADATLRRDEQREDEPTDQHDVAQSSAPPDVQADASQRHAAAQTVSGVRGDAVVSWQGLLLGHLQQYRRYPRQAERLRQQGVAYVRFAVDRQGNASNVRIGRSSGHLLLDEETLATVQRGSPLPAPPDDVPGNPVEVMVPVEFFLHRQ
ncbi:energy transducer TonB [Stenotrophomonas tumulicola]|uniref:Energy transducer TonB n=1 Tax=Stenotrophomonas tumulicola TaxID=1685415 RepID=A0A7W3FPM5_9GAMM|nr:energy transducer TonB [Stenotrophomonas tumulicola]MBA8683443.1 energy transducer TonB [Stenotrophomonas tumulicola]